MREAAGVTIGALLGLSVLVFGLLAVWGIASVGLIVWGVRQQRR